MAHRWTGRGASSPKPHSEIMAGEGNKQMMNGPMLTRRKQLGTWIIEHFNLLQAEVSCK